MSRACNPSDIFRKIKTCIEEENIGYTPQTLHVHTPISFPDCMCTHLFHKTYKYHVGSTSREYTSLLIYIIYLYTHLHSFIHQDFFSHEETYISCRIHVSWVHIFINTYCIPITTHTHLCSYILHTYIHETRTTMHAYYLGAYLVSIHIDLNLLHTYTNKTHTHRRTHTI